MRRSGPCNLEGEGEGVGLSKGASRRAEGLLELLEVVSAGFWCQEHVLRFRGKSSPQPLPPLSIASIDPTAPVTPAPDSSRRRVEVTKKKKRKKRNGKKEGKRRNPILPTSNNARNNRDRARGVELEKRGTIENALLTGQEPIAADRWMDKL